MSLNIILDDNRQQGRRSLNVCFIIKTKQPQRLCMFFF